MKKGPEKKAPPKDRHERMKTLWRAHSKKRHERYKKDASYRETVQADRRRAMQERRGTKLTDCRANLSELEDIGTKRRVTLDGGPSMRLCFTVAEAAEALMLSASRMRVWIKEGVVPEPVVHADVEDEKTMYVKTPTVAVYLKPELEVIIRLTGEHRSRIAYIRRGQHDALIKKVSNQVSEVRRRTGIA